MNTDLSVPSENTLNTSINPNEGESDSKGKLNNYAVTKTDPGDTASKSKGLAFATNGFGRSLETREVSSVASADATEAATDNVVFEIKEHMKELKEKLLENDEYYKPKQPSPYIDSFEKAIKLLDNLKPESLSKGKVITDGCFPDGALDGSRDSYYEVYYENKLLFTVIETEGEARFATRFSPGESGKIEDTELLDQLYSLFFNNQFDQ